MIQFLADLLDTPVINPGIPDVSALGAARIASIGSGLIEDIKQIYSSPAKITVYEPGPGKHEINGYYEEWKNWVNRLF